LQDRSLSAHQPTEYSANHRKVTLLQTSQKCRANHKCRANLQKKTHWMPCLAGQGSCFAELPCKTRHPGIRRDLKRIIECRVLQGSSALQNTASNGSFKFCFLQSSPILFSYRIFHISLPSIGPIDEKRLCKDPLDAVPHRTGLFLQISPQSMALICGKRPSKTHRMPYLARAGLFPEVTPQSMNLMCGKRPTQTR